MSMTKRLDSYLDFKAKLNKEYNKKNPTAAKLHKAIHMPWFSHDRVQNCIDRATNFNEFYRCLMFGTTRV